MFVKIVLGFLGISFLVAIVFGVVAKGYVVKEWASGCI